MPQPTIPTLPDYPQQSDPANFATEAETWSAALPDWTTQANSMGTYITTQATDATTQATNAANSAAAALVSETNAGAAAQFQGNWSSLVGALAIGKTVYHAYRYWISRVSIADVTLSEPASSNTDWGELYKYSVYNAAFAARYYR